MTNGQSQAKEKNSKNTTQIKNTTMENAFDIAAEFAQIKLSMPKHTRSVKVKKENPRKRVYMSTNHLNQEVVVQFQYGSSNTKVGDSVQIWIMPLRWIHEGKKAMQDDSASCMNCPHSKAYNGTCYVRKGNSNQGLNSKVASLHNAYLKGELDMLPMSAAVAEVDNCRGKFIRFGAYGEPVLMGEEIVSKLASVASKWAGYTHQWYVQKYNWASKYFMASVETEGLKARAEKFGFRTFRVRNPHSVLNDNEVICPASKEGGNKVTCNTCGLCKGNALSAKSIAIILH
jgi:hypothetical protein